ncbi:hypothetical protein KDX25_20295 [Burkholderia cenocepacia]|uniref:hypothetical protein n=1 Tax=Burkholderia cenocepacia TaxID=95486 RepID=UPI000F582EE9|nr:hypothetical protein [Burkholderia cenocepacia]MBR8308746.1 hypothetical protein [Burkholderia cenocepacia]RQU98735.1 hypothetical protein DF042_23430 [Burkholderia cenocepacia]
MSKESNDVADLRRFAVSLSDELEIVSEEVVRLMHCLDAYQMVLEGLCVAHRDQQTVLREVENQIEQVVQILSPKPTAETGTSPSSWSTSSPYWLHLVDQAARNQEEQRQLRRQLPHPDQNVDEAAADAKTYARLFEKSPKSTAGSQLSR